MSGHDERRTEDDEIYDYIFGMGSIMNTATHGAWLPTSSDQEKVDALPGLCLHAAMRCKLCGIFGSLCCFGKDRSVTPLTWQIAGLLIDGGIQLVIEPGSKRERKCNCR
jgi:hypothetical protein